MNHADRILDELEQAAARMGIELVLPPVTYTLFSDRRRCPCCGSHFWADGDASSQQELHRAMGDHRLLRSLRGHLGRSPQVTRAEEPPRIVHHTADSR